MTDLVHYSLTKGVANIQLDDGKRNAVSSEMFRQIYSTFDRAEADRATVILTGREQVFCAGFNLKVMKGPPLDALRMLNAGYSLTARTLTPPKDIFCTAHTQSPLRHNNKWEFLHAQRQTSQTRVVNTWIDLGHL